MTLFSDLKLDQNVLKAINEVGYDKPTPIQAGAIPPALEGRDVLGIAQTGTGKTASFTLPVITRLSRGRARARMPRSLVLAPTRELAAQVAENFDLYAKYTRLTKALLIGGVSFGEQDKLIDRGVDVLIATPGRLLDHFERGKLLLTGVQIMVVDEADRMLDMGFIPDIERIFQLTPANRQTLFFSATMAPEIERITNTFLHSPERIEVARQATTSENIEQRLVELSPTRKDQAAKQKRELLRAIITAEGENLKNAIIFSNRKTDVDIVAKSLRVHGYDAQAIHGDLDQNHRTKTLEDFREGRLRFLVASDVAARGLDIPAVSHVFNYDLPSHAEDYVHRIGRTGRAGRKGTAISISVPADEKYLAAIENLVKHALPRIAAPEGFKITEPQRNQRNNGNNEGAEPRQSRSRTRTRAPRQNEDAAAQQAQPASDTTVTPPAREQQPRAAQLRNGNDEERRQNNRQNDRAPRQQEDRGRGGAIIGMGDHVPEFMTRSFYDALKATERASAETAANGAETAERDDTAPVKTEAGERSSNSRRGSRRRSNANNQQAKPAPDQPEAVVEATTTVAAETPAVDAAPAADIAVAEATVPAVAETQPAAPEAATAPADTVVTEAVADPAVEAPAEGAKAAKPATRTRTTRARSTAAKAKPAASAAVTAEPESDKTDAPAETAVTSQPDTAEPKAGTAPEAVTKAPAKRTTTRRTTTPRSTTARTAAAKKTTTADEAPPAEGGSEATDKVEAPKPAPRTRTTTARKTAATKAAAAKETGLAAPSTDATTTAASASEAPVAEGEGDAAPAAPAAAPKPRATRATTAAKPRAAAKTPAAKTTTAKAAAKPAATKAAAAKPAATKAATSKTAAPKATATRSTATKAAAAKDAETGNDAVAKDAETPES